MAKLEEWQRDLVSNVDDKAVRDLVSDFRNYQVGPSQGPAAKVTVQGAGVVKDADLGPAYRPYVEQGGWVKPPQVDQWKPPGLSVMDAMLDQADALDKAERVKKLIEAAAALQALKPREPEDKK
jgi:hypothetical protein